MKNSLRIHKWTHNEFNIFILGVLTRPHRHNTPNVDAQLLYLPDNQSLRSSDSRR